MRPDQKLRRFVPVCVCCSVDLAGACVLFDLIALGTNSHDVVAVAVLNTVISLQVMEHRSAVTDLLKKFSPLKSSAQSLVPSSSHHKNCSS